MPNMILKQTPGEGSLEREGGGWLGRQRSGGWVKLGVGVGDRTVRR